MRKVAGCYSILVEVSRSPPWLAVVLLIEIRFVDGPHVDNQSPKRRNDLDLLL